MALGGLPFQFSLHLFIHMLRGARVLVWGSALLVHIGPVLPLTTVTTRTGDEKAELQNI